MTRLISLTAAILATIAPNARADEAPTLGRLGLYVDGGYLGSPGTSGGAIGTGLRLGLGGHFAVSFDMGYGLVGSASVVQDRWWVMPAVAVVIPAGRLRIDLGAGGGVGTSSGYVSMRDYIAKPFTPIWHFTVPAVRVHAVAAYETSHNLEVFARADVASLLTVSADKSALDTTWYTLSAGVQVSFL